MNSSDYLYRLVQSLSVTEKRYFINRSANYGKGLEKDYIRLYYVLEEMISYSEEALRKKLTPKMVKTLPMLKKYLYDELLDTLVEYQAQQLPEVNLYRNLSHGQVLLERNLVSQAGEVFKKAAISAKKLNNPLIEAEAWLGVAQADFKEIETVETLPSADTWMEENLWLQRLQKPPQSDDDTLWMGKKLLELSELPLDGKQELQWLQASVQVALFQKDFPGVLSYLRKIQIALSQGPFSETETYQRKQIQHLFQSVQVCLQGGLIADALHYLTVLRTLPTKNFRLEAEKHKALLEIEPWMARKTAKQGHFMYSRWNDLTQNSKNWLPNLESEKAATILLELATTAFEGNKPDEAQKTLNLIKGVEGLNLSVETQKGIRALECLNAAFSSDWKGLKNKLSAYKKYLTTDEDTKFWSSQLKQIADFQLAKKPSSIPEKQNTHLLIKDQFAGLFPDFNFWLEQLYWALPSESQPNHNQ